jgi:hypothetical protein
MAWQPDGGPLNRDLLLVAAGLRQAESVTRIGLLHKSEIVPIVHLIKTFPRGFECRGLRSSLRNSIDQVGCRCRALTTRDPMLGWALPAAAAALLRGLRLPT